MSVSLALLIARQRTGTGALGSALGQHPGVSFRGEVFHPEAIDSEENFFHFLRASSKSLEELLLPQHALENFKQFVAATTPTGQLPLIDVKYNSLHLLQQAWRGPEEAPCILQYCGQNNFPIIRLSRNLLEVFVSARLAEINNVWHASPTDKIDVTSVTVDFEQLVEFLKVSTAEDQMVDYWLNNYPRLLTVNYADLFDSSGILNSETGDAICDLLDLPHHPQMISAWTKQAPSSLKKSVANYEELAISLRNTHYRELLPEFSDPHT
jgi:hypothetical protein